MNFYLLVLFLHIIGAAGLFLGLGMERITLNHLNRASIAEQVLSWGPSLKLIRISFSISAVLLLLSGIYMAERVWGWTGWVIVGLIMLITLSGAGSMGGKKIVELMKSLSNSTGSLSSEVREKVSDSFLHKSYKVRILLVIGTMFIMTMKTNWLESIVTILIAFLIGLLISVISRKVQESA
jgi:hypothetical protein